MSPTLTRDQDAMRRLAEAAAWRVRLTEEDVETSEAFEDWMADPANVAAWDRVQAPWRQVGEKATSPELMALRAGALARAQKRGRRWMGGMGSGIAAGLAAMILVTGGYGGWRWHETRPQDYRTVLGERRVIPLPDGSRVSLDSGSEVRIRYTKDARKLELLAGQARFDVAHDVQRPFSVTAGNQTVVATGTAFNVDLLGSKVLVTLIEGHVVVLQEPARKRLVPVRALPAPAAPAVELTAGEQLIAAPAAAPQVQQASLERATAWESGQLAFKDEPLGSVAERVSRYAARPVVVAPDAAGLRVSGVFKAGDIASFVDIVTSYLPVRAVKGADGEITLKSNG